jgi:hypothetical protein
MSRQFVCDVCSKAAPEAVQNVRVLPIRGPHGAPIRELSILPIVGVGRPTETFVCDGCLAGWLDEARHQFSEMQR